MTYFIRHSEKLDFPTDERWKKHPRFSVNPYDSPLSENGFTLARKFISNLLHNNTKKYRYIYSSPLTRCIETSLVFQRYILEKDGILVPIRIEYGLTEIGHNMCELNNLKLVNNKVIIADPNLPIDKELHEKNIMKKFGKKNFDDKYQSIISKETINANINICQQYNTCLDMFKKISKKLEDDTHINLLCTSGRVMLLLMSYIKGEMDFETLRGQFGWCVGADVTIKNKKIKLNKIIAGFK